MIVLTLDGVDTPVRSFCARATGQAELQGIYLVDCLFPDGSSGRWWAKATGVMTYLRIAACAGIGCW